MGTLHIATAQLNFLVGDIEGNADRIIQESKRIVAEKPTDLILFPELALCGYPPEDLLFRPEFHARCKKALALIQAAITNTAIIIGYPEEKEGKYYNNAMLISHGKCLATYSKQKLPNYTVFDEKRYFSPGQSPCVFELKDTRIGLLICEDIWFPEPIQQAKEAGAQLIVNINASPYEKNKVERRENTLKKRAEESHLPIIYANLVGGQDELVFDGGSMVIDAKGNRTQQALYCEETILRTDLEVDQYGTVTPASQPLPNRLSPEESIYKTLTLAVHDYITKNGFPGALLGLSGGIDSALTLAIACDAIGREKVIAVIMPSRYTAPISIEDAITQAKQLGVTYHIISIDEIFDLYLKTLEPIFSGLKPNFTEENIQARIRGNLLMALSNKLGHLVLTTSNKSEMAVGYATLYGDMAGGFSTLKDVPKTWVYKLAEYRNTIDSVIPSRVITRAPTAELAPNQKDQDTLPPYDILDEILFRYIEQDQSQQAICEAGFDQNTVERIAKMVSASEYKRRQAAIGARLSQRAFGKDRRYPVTSGFVK